MSQRHRSQEAIPPPKMDSRAHAHNERHRIHSVLQQVTAQVSAGYEPDEVHEPGRAWVPAHHRDPERAKAKDPGTRISRHWKLKMWKRRTTIRRAKAQAFRIAD
ncbi:MAG TPA: hypothetical protein VLD86_13900 [Ilumatobacteraceae bacterium]|nr:hypothetical protein [Ilumatobacteraceae bacterium]